MRPGRKNLFQESTDMGTHGTAGSIAQMHLQDVKRQCQVLVYIARDGKSSRHKSESSREHARRHFPLASTTYEKAIGARSHRQGERAVISGRRTCATHLYLRARQRHPALTLQHARKRDWSAVSPQGYVKFSVGSDNHPVVDGLSVPRTRSEERRVGEEC